MPTVTIKKEKKKDRFNDPLPRGTGGVSNPNQSNVTRSRALKNSGVKPRSSPEQRAIRAEDEARTPEQERQRIAEFKKRSNISGTSAEEVRARGLKKSDEQIAAEARQKLEERDAALLAVEPPQVQEEPEEKRGFLENVKRGLSGELAQEAGLSPQLTEEFPILPGGVPQGTSLFKGLAISDKAKNLAKAKKTITNARAADTVQRSNKILESVKKLGKWGLAAAVITPVGVVTSKVLGRGDAIIRSMESEMGLMSEEIPDLFKEVAVGAVPAEFGLDEVDSMIEDIEEMDNAVQKAKIYSFSARTNPEFTGPFDRRKSKQRRKLNTVKFEIAKIQASGVLPDEEQIALILQGLE